MALLNIDDLKSKNIRAILVALEPVTMNSVRLAKDSVKSPWISSDLIPFWPSFRPIAVATDADPEKTRQIARKSTREQIAVDSV